MGKLIAVCGSPGSGKTTASLKLAQEIYSAGGGRVPVIYVSTDPCVPAMAYIFPDGRDSSLFSLGEALDRTDIFPEDIIRRFVCAGSMKNFAFMGYKLGENKYSYPAPTADKAAQFLKAAAACAEYVVADCSSYDDDIIARMAIRDCGSAVQLFNPDIRCIAYYASCADRFIPVKGREAKVLNITGNDIYYPVAEAGKHFGITGFLLPYSHALKKQTETGGLSGMLRDREYRAAVRKIAEAVM